MRPSLRRLVRESLREREALLQAFPRLVRPLPFLRSLRTRISK